MAAGSNRIGSGRARDRPGNSAAHGHQSADPAGIAPGVGRGGMSGRRRVRSLDLAAGAAASAPAASAPAASAPAASAPAAVMGRCVVVIFLEPTSAPTGSTYDVEIAGHVTDARAQRGGVESMRAEVMEDGGPVIDVGST